MRQIDEVFARYGVKRVSPCVRKPLAIENWCGSQQVVCTKGTEVQLGIPGLEPPSRAATGERILSKEWETAMTEFEPAGNLGSLLGARCGPFVYGAARRAPPRGAGLVHSGEWESLRIGPCQRGEIPQRPPKPEGVSVNRQQNGAPINTWCWKGKARLTEENLPQLLERIAVRNYGPERGRAIAGQWIAAGGVLALEIQVNKVLSFLKPTGKAFPAGIEPFVGPRRIMTGSSMD